MTAMLAGAALRDVTPYDRPVSIPGHALGSSRTDRVDSPLAVRVLALDDGRARLLLAVADCLWWPPEAAEGARATVAASLGLDPDHVVLHATHTHTAPQPGTKYAPHLGQPDPAFLATLVAAVVDAGREALGRLVPVTLEQASTRHRIGVHRRRLVDGVVTFAPDPAVPIDDRVRVAQLRAGAEVVATLVHHACHATTTATNAVSSDWPGVIARTLDATLGGVTVVVQGCAGDVRPALVDGDRFVPGDEADAVRLGTGLADAVLAALPGTTTDWTPLRVDARTVPLTLESGTEVPLHAVGVHAGWSLVGLGCEPVGRFQEAAPQAWVLGYTNGMIGYVTTAAQRQAGGYEPLGSLPAFGLDSPFGPDTEATVAALVADLAR